MQLPDKKTWLFIGAALLIGVTISGLIGYGFWNKTQQQVKKLTADNQALLYSYDNLYANQQQPAPAPEPTNPNYQNGNPFVDVTSNTINVDWLAKPSILKSDKIDFFLNSVLLKGYGGGSDDASFKIENLVVGKVQDSSSPYANWKIVQSHFGEDADMGGSTPRVATLLLAPDDSFVAVLSNPNGYAFAGRERKFVLEGVTIANEATGPTSTIPQTLTLQNGNTIYTNDSPGQYGYGVICLSCAAGVDSSDYKYLTTSKEGVRLYSSAQSGWTWTKGIGAYSFDTKGQGIYYYSVIGKGIPPIQWSVTNSTTLEYVERYPGGGGGCGGSPNVTTDKDLGEVQEVGTLPNGDKIYAPKDIRNNKLVNAAYDAWFPNYDYQATNDENAANKPSFDAFLKKYPVPFFVWKNAFGTWLTYAVNEIGPIGECGKPVIYLYPEKDTNVSVRLPSKINVTVSDPTYPKNGWNVLAKPDGSLIYQDGKTYGSLFWEGTGVGYDIPTTGFVVKDGDVSSFLAKTLPRYGLNVNETKEFMDFWVPKFHGAPYYRISFLTSEWSKAAPLNVSPLPKTQIRLFMDWSPLSGPITIKQPTIATPSRDGFTLVEWGGLLRK